MNTNIFNKQQYDLVIEKTPKQSLSFGRHIYLLKQDESLYWLKYQDVTGHPQFIEGLAREIEIYQQYPSASFILPHQILFSDSTQKSPNMLRTIHSDVALPEIFSLSHAQIIQKVFDVLQCVAALHQVGLIHGDLKPSHLRYYQKSVRLLDFEQSENFTSVSDHSAMNATPRYMAPELFHLAPKSPQTDLYALGIIFFEWLSQSSIAVKKYHDWAIFHCQNSNFQLPNQFASFQFFLDRLLARKKQQRFLTAEQAIQFWLNQQE